MTGKRNKRADADPPKSFRCTLCGRKVRKPEGWGTGSSVRKHYWARHPQVMTKGRK